MLWLAVEAVCILTYRSSEEEIVAEEEQNHEDDEADENAVDDAASLACLACFAGLEFCLVFLVHGSKWSLCTLAGNGRHEVRLKSALLAVPPVQLLVFRYK